MVSAKLSDILLYYKLVCSISSNLETEALSVERMAKVEPGKNGICTLRKSNLTLSENMNHPNSSLATRYKIEVNPLPENFPIKNVMNQDESSQPLASMLLSKSFLLRKVGEVDPGTRWYPPMKIIRLEAPSDLSKKSLRRARHRAL